MPSRAGTYIHSLKVMHCGTSNQCSSSWRVREMSIELFCTSDDSETIVHCYYREISVSKIESNQKVMREPE